MSCPRVSAPRLSYLARWLAWFFMIPGKCVSLATTDGELIEVGKGFLLRHPMGALASLQVIGIFWSDGAANEPPHWEVLTLPPFLAELTAKVDPDVVLRTTKMVLDFQQAVLLPDGEIEAAKMKAKETAYKDFPMDRMGEIQEFANKLVSAQEQIAKAGTIGEVYYIPDHRVRLVRRAAQLHEMMDLMILRNALEESTRSGADEEEEETEAAPENPAVGS